MSGNTKLLEFNDFFVKEYKYLLGFTRSIDTRNDYESLLHDCYLKIANRIKLSGYSGSTYLNYMRCTIMNKYKTFYRDRKFTIEFDNPDYISEVETVLLEENEYQDIRQEHDSDMGFLNSMAFEYVDKYFDEKQYMIFKTYFVLKHKHLNYKQLAVATNLSQTSVSKTIKHIKKELRFNLMCYINNGKNVMEMKELLTKAEAVLAKDLNRNKAEYSITYQQIFGKPWTGCSCNLRSMRESIRMWYDKNKNILNT